MKIGLVISTYNRADALEVCLKSVLNQVVPPDEILIADDGSGTETRQLIENYKQLFNVPLIHIWHEDNGFELAKVRNKAIACSTSDYIVQIDGDLILHKYFIKDHRAFARPNSFVRASRIYLDEELTNQKLEDRSIAVNRFKSKLSNFFSAFRVPVLQGLLATNYKVKGDELWEIHGCNMAFWRQDAIAVNGYNEDFKGWGPEDKEFVARLLNKGVQKRFLKFGGIVFHLWHAVNAKENLDANNVIFKTTKESKLTYCKNGIDKYLV
ncbi:MAG: glycosyltransferase family 2 protein [Sphingobacterium sp.]|jgi:glycosyltransferase involved in cell wall biosynthesis|nr:glycosyltransferase family 2 protein [Sphingobacterium sp.]